MANFNVLEIKRLRPYYAVNRFETSFIEKGDYWIFLEEDATQKAQCTLVLINDPEHPELGETIFFLIVTAIV